MKKPPTILLTGFEPFDGQATNPSWEAVRVLHGKRIGGHRIIARCLPVTFDASSKQLRLALRESSPVLVACVGQAGGRERISLERVAININDARIADNGGHQPIDEAIVPGGPAAYFSTLPIKAMLAGLSEAGFPVDVSQTAGTYVCNHAFYVLMHALRNRRNVRAGFIHIPYSPEQAASIADAPSLDIQAVSAALRLALRIAIDTGNDPRIGAGAEH